MDNNRAALNAVDTKQRQIIVDVLLVVACEIQERAVLSTQVADFVFVVCSLKKKNKTESLRPPKVFLGRANERGTTFPHHANTRHFN